MNEPLCFPLTDGQPEKLTFTAMMPPFNKVQASWIVIALLLNTTGCWNKANSWEKNGIRIIVDSDSGDPIRASVISPAVTDDDLAVLSRYPTLQTVFLNGSSVTDSGLKHLVELENLELLSLNETRVSGAALNQLRNLSSLRSLHLERVTLSEEGFRQLMRLGHLSEISLLEVPANMRTVLQLLKAHPDTTIHWTQEPSEKHKLATTHIERLGGMVMWIPRKSPPEVRKEVAGIEGIIHSRPTRCVAAVSIDGRWKGGVGEVSYLRDLDSLGYVSLSDRQFNDGVIQYLLDLPDLQKVRIHSTDLTDEGIKILKEKLTDVVVEPSGLHAWKSEQ